MKGVVRVTDRGSNEYARGGWKYVEVKEWKKQATIEETNIVPMDGKIAE
jgi:hypothetical protein